MQFFDFGTIFFLVAAVVIFFQLRNVLGRRTGNERPPFDPYSTRSRSRSAPSETNDNVVSLPNRKGAATAPQPVRDLEESFAAIDALTKPGTSVNEGLKAITKADQQFDVKKFLEGAKMAYEMIVMSFADGDRRTLKTLLSKDVYEGFVAAIDERERNGQKIESSFVGIDKANIIAAELKGTEAHITLRIVSELISATRDSGGEIVDGDPETVAEVKDVWTFARDTRARDPNWKLVATEAED